MNPWHILFDLDGTLTDPKPGITRCIQYALVKLGAPVPDAEDLLWCIGPPLQDSCRRLLPEPTPELVQEAVAWYRERYVSIGMFENEVYAGIPEALGALQQDGYHLHLATSKARVYAVEILKHFHLSPYFEEIFGSELDGRLSQKSELIAHILDARQISRYQCMMVGDREHDIIGAQANRVPTIGVTYGYGSRAELQAAGAETLIDMPADLENAVTAIVLGQ